MKRRKTIRAGRLVYDCAYTMSYPTDAPRVRKEKRKCSSAARQRMNLKQSARKLELALAANFGTRDLVLTLDYADGSLPADRPEAVLCLKKFLRQLRDVRRKRNGELRYIYVTEGLYGDKRVHHHLVINGTDADLETLRSLWPYGGVSLARLSLRDGYYALAEYLTKEPRNGDRTLNGARCWTPSKGLRKPEIECSTIPDSLTLSVPPGAVVLDSDSIRNEFGDFVFLKYLLPEPRECKTRKPGRAAVGKRKMQRRTCKREGAVIQL